jgi:outer membrane protein assembly factor BamB
MFYALDVDSGRVAWSFNVAADQVRQFHGRPLIVDSLIIIAADDGRLPFGALYALNRLNGEIIWKSTTDVGLPSDVARGNDSLLYVVTFNDELRAYSLHSGKVIWSFATGWTRDPDFTPATALERPRTPVSPYVRDTLLYFVGRDSTMYCRDARSGGPVWSHHFDDVVTSEPLIDKHHVLLGLGPYKLACLDRLHGVLTRTDSLLSIALLGMAQVQDEILYLGGYEAAEPLVIEAFDRESAAARWRYWLEGDHGYWYVPRVHLWNNQAIVGSTHGLVVALDVETGVPVWRLQLKGGIRGIGDGAGKIFVGTYEGTLYALSMKQTK